MSAKRSCNLFNGHSFTQFLLSKIKFHLKSSSFALTEAKFLQLKLIFPEIKTNLLTKIAFPSISVNEK